MNKKESETYDYESQIPDDATDFTGVDIRINPDFYLHHAIIKSQNALIHENTEAGFIQYRLLVEHIELLAKAANKIPQGYDEEIKAFTETNKQYIEEKVSIIKHVLLANKKLELLTKQIFGSKYSTQPLKL